MEQCQGLDVGEVGDLVVLAFNKAQERLEENFMAQGLEAPLVLRDALGGGPIGPRVPEPVG